MLLLLLQQTPTIERKLLMAGFLEVHALEAKSFLPNEQLQSFSVSSNFQLNLYPEASSFSVLGSMYWQEQSNIIVTTLIF